MADSYMSPGAGAIPYSAPGSSYINYGEFPAAPVTMPDTRGEFSKGLSRGVDSLQQMGYGAAGLLSDIVGAEKAKEYFYDQAQQQQAEQALAPAAVPQFTDVYETGFDVGKLSQWFMGAVGEALPSSAASLISSGTGALLFRAATLKLARDTALKGALAGQIEKLAATGIAKQEAEKIVTKEFFKSEIAKQAASTGASRGAYAGAMTAGSGMEAGSNWIEDVQKHGLVGSDPIKDLAFGIAGGAVEAGLGAERRLIGQIAKQKAEKELLGLAARKGILGAAQTVGGEVLKSSAGEGAEEFAQQLLNQASTMRNASLDDMLYAKQDFKSAFNAGMAGAAGGVLFGATGGTRAHLGSRGYEGSQNTQNAAEVILERKNATLEVANQKVQATSQQYDAGLAQLDAGRQKLMDNLRQISITVQDPAQQQQLMSQVQQQLIEANAQRVNLQKEKDNYLEVAKKEVTKYNKKEELKIIEAEAEETVKAPKSLLEIKKRSLEEERKATGLAAIDTHAQREIDKVDNRVVEHQKAIEALNTSITNTVRNGGIIGSENVDLLKWHEQQIADERKYASNVLKEYNKAKDPKSLTESRLFDLYRDKDHATNLTAYEYQTRTKGLADSVLSDAIKAKKAPTEAISLVERLNSKREQNALRNSALNSIDGMTRAISAATRMNEINNVLKPAAQRRDVARMANQVAESMRIPTTTVTSAMPLERARRPLGAQVQPSGYQTLLNNRRMVEIQKQQELAAAARAGAKIMHDSMIAQEKTDKVAYQKLSMDKNQARNEGRKRLVSGWIANTIDQLKSLKDVVKVIHSDETYLLPDYVQEAYSGKGSALIDLNTGTIYMFADKMHNKQHAVRTLLHESVAHFGLRAIMTPDQLDKFLHMVAREFVGTDRWQDIASRYKDYDTFSIAEEYVAKYAEELRLNEKTMTRAKLMFEKVKTFFKQLLETLGLVKVTDQDIQDVLLASAYNLTQGKSLRKQVASHADTNQREVMNVESDKFKEWFGKSKLVDSEGTPLILYHGTVDSRVDKNFTTSTEGALGSGIYFTPDPDYANHYAKDSGGKVFPVYARMTNPVVVDNTTHIDPAISVLMKLGIEKAKAQTIADKAYEEKGGFTKQLQTRARAYGHDGIVYYRDGKIQEVVVFNPAQIKSIWNDGNYNSYSKNISESRYVADDGAWRNVRESREYDSMIAEPIKRAKKLLNSTNTTIGDGKIIPSDKLTLKEQVIMVAADAQYPVLNLQKHQELLTGRAIPTNQNWYMADKAAQNKEAREAAHFNREVIGWDPTNPSYKAKEGQLAFEINKLATPGQSTKDLLELVGKVLAYYHAPEANAALAAKSVNSKKLANVDKKIATLKAEKAKGNLTAARAVALEEELVKAAEVRAEMLDVRQDLFMGVSTEDALKFIDKVVNKSPNKLQWMKVITMVQDINKRILDKAVANELITPEFRKLLDDTYEFYVPNRAWTDTMERRSPGFGQKSKIFNEHNYKFTQERKGSEKMGVNPLIALILKHSDVVVAAQSKKDYSMLADNIQANKEMYSEIFVEDDKRAVKEASDKLKASLKNAEELMPKENLRTISDVIRGLYRRINELSVEQVRHQRNILKYTTDEARANADAALTQVEADIANARETIALLKDKRFTLLNSPAYADVVRTIKANRDELRASRKDRGWTRSYNDAGELVWTRNPSKFTGQMDKIITLTNSQGETTRYMVTNDIILAALKGTSTVEPGPIIRFLGSLQRKMAMLMTTLNPVFTAVNGFRDWVTANIHIRHLADDITGMDLTRNELTSRYNAIFFGTNGNQSKSALRLMYKYAREGTTGDAMWDAKIKEFEKSGAYTTMFNLGSHAQIEQSLVKAIDRAGENENMTKQALYATMNWLTDASGAVENASRFSAYVVISDALVAKGMSVAEAQKIAGDAALDLTVNFTKRGQWGPIISSLFLFGQANINSTIRIMRAMFPASDKGKPMHQRRITRYVSGLLLLGFMMSMLARAMGGDDDDGMTKYDKLSENKRDTNLIFSIPFVEGKFLTLPVTFGYQLFYTMGSVISDMFVGRTNKAEAFSRIVDSSLQNFFLVGGGGSGIIELTPSVFKPLVQIAANTNYFGSKVYPDAKSWEKGAKPDSQKHWKNTPEAFKYFAETVNSMFGGTKDRSAGVMDISPASIDHAFRSYLGGVGDLLIKSSALAANVVMGRSEAIKTGDIPLISRFAASPTIENTLHEYTKYKKEVETQVAEYKRAKEEKVDGETMQKIATETSKARLLNMKLETVQKQMAAISAEENKMLNNPSISSETKFNKKQLDDKKNESLAKSFIKSAIAAKVR